MERTARCAVLHAMFHVEHLGGSEEWSLARNPNATRVSLRASRHLLDEGEVRVIGDRLNRAHPKGAEWCFRPTIQGAVRGLGDEEVSARAQKSRRTLGEDRWRAKGPSDHEVSPPTKSLVVSEILSPTAANDYPTAQLKLVHRLLEERASSNRTIEEDHVGRVPDPRKDEARQAASGTQIDRLRWLRKSSGAQGICVRRGVRHLLLDGNWPKKAKIPASLQDGDQPGSRHRALGPLLSCLRGR